MANAYFVPRPTASNVLVKREEFRRIEITGFVLCPSRFTRGQHFVVPYDHRQELSDNAGRCQELPIHAIEELTFLDQLKVREVIVVNPLDELHLDSIVVGCPRRRSEARPKDLSCANDHGGMTTLPPNDKRILVPAN